jgi:two-component system phosphate regulon sensor histidine kinase PhoR
VQRTLRLNRSGQRLTYQAVASRTPGGGVLIVLRDVTTLSAAVQMKTDFVANASHELRTPIAALKVAFETLSEVYQDDPQQAARCVEIVEGHVKRLEEMLRDLLDLSRVEAPELKPFIKDVRTADFFALMRSSLGAMAQRKLVELRFSGEANGPSDPPTPGTFLSDERLLNLVLKNLVENSIKFTPPGGSVTLAVQTEPGGAGEAESIVITVADTGIGIPSEHLDRVFERFYQVDASRTGSAGRGTGLGLAIVKHAVAALGGTVEMTSVVGSGTKVTCTLPQNIDVFRPVAEASD